MNNIRCEEALVKFIVRTYDDSGAVIGEQESQPTKVFRSNVPNVWSWIDEVIASSPTRKEK